MAGAGKSSIAAHFADAGCRRGERCLYFAFEESPAQVIRNMRSIGFDLGRWVERGLLRFSANRPSLCGLEMHLAVMHRQIEQFAPQIVVVDPISSLLAAGVQADVQAVLLRLVDALKSRGITTLLTNLSHGLVEMGQTDVGMSSLMDSWVLLLNREVAGEHNRELYLLKSRGMAHSNQVREFLLTDHGVELRPVFLGPEGMVTGSGRLAYEARERAEAAARRQEAERRQRALARRRRQIERQIEDLRAELDAEAQELETLADETAERDAAIETSRIELARSRKSG
jgi:circadian clock protein KaiC